MFQNVRYDWSDLVIMYQYCEDYVYAFFILSTTIGHRERIVTSLTFL